MLNKFFSARVCWNIVDSVQCGLAVTLSLVTLLPPPSAAAVRLRGRCANCSKDHLLLKAIQMSDDTLHHHHALRRLFVLQKNNSRDSERWLRALVHNLRG